MPVVGVRNALDRGVARRSVPVFATPVGATLGVATIVATLTFVASQDHCRHAEPVRGHLGHPDR